MNIHVGDFVQTTVRGNDPSTSQFYHGADTAEVLAIKDNIAFVNWGEWDEQYEEPTGVDIQEIPLQYLHVYQRGSKF